MDLERMFMSCYKIQEKPDDMFSLIQFALNVGAYNYPAQFQKRKARIIRFLMDPSITAGHLMLSDDEDEEEDDRIADDDGEEEVIKKQDEPEEEKQVTCSPTNCQKPTRKIKLPIKKTVQVASVTELKKTSQTMQLDAADKRGTSQSHNTTTTAIVASRKRMSLNVSSKHVQVAPPRAKQLSDSSSFKKQLEGGEQLKGKGNFKKMERDAEKKREEGSQQTPTQRRRKECTSDMKKFETSKRKFEERLAEQRDAKRRIIMVDFYDMPKPANGPRAPRKRCWERKRF